MLFSYTKQPLSTSTKEQNPASLCKKWGLSIQAHGTLGLRVNIFSKNLTMKYYFSQELPRFQLVKVGIEKPL